MFTHFIKSKRYLLLAGVALLGLACLFSRAFAEEDYSSTSDSSDSSDSSDASADSLSAYRGAPVTTPSNRSSYASSASSNDFAPVDSSGSDTTADETSSAPTEDTSTSTSTEYATSASTELPVTAPVATTTPAANPADFTSETPKIILDGLEAYTVTGAESAITTWVAGGPMEGDPSTLSGADTFKNVEAHYGHYQGYQLIESKVVSSTAKLIYLQMNYEKGPLFTRFLCYWTGNSWIVTGRLTFNIDPTEVLNSK